MDLFIEWFFTSLIFGTTFTLCVLAINTDEALYGTQDLKKITSYDFTGKEVIKNILRALKKALPIGFLVAFPIAGLTVYGYSGLFMWPTAYILALFVYGMIYCKDTYDTIIKE